jgi:uncharacterized protein YdhG (YjbR/CyaY superfamily)
MYKSLINNQDLVKDVSAYLHLDPQREEVVDIFEEDGQSLVETRVGERGFQDDGCLQDNCTKESCLNCLARQEKRQFYKIK